MIGRMVIAHIDAIEREIAEREAHGLPADGFPNAHRIPLRAKYLPGR